MTSVSSLLRSVFLTEQFVSRFSQNWEEIFGQGPWLRVPLQSNMSENYWLFLEVTDEIIAISGPWKFQIFYIQKIHGKTRLRHHYVINHFRKKVNNFPRHSNLGGERCQIPFPNISSQFWENRLTNCPVKKN